MGDIDLIDEERVTLVEILDRVLNKGIVVSGDVIISIAEVDLIYVGLRLLVTSVENIEKMPHTPLHLANHKKQTL